ncbi:hypothetical protein FS837_004785 [Tulasnella sp. UAMH 9824]|nr:hypothetical protein FS837_004785 [Tulasnella sp. UAMH 9824]
MIIADPHFKDSRVFSKHPVGLGTRIREFFIRLNIRKSWNAVSQLNPQIVIVLGDMLDQGRAIMTDDEYERYYQHFHNTFKHDPSVKFVYVTGNHDVGLGSHKSFSGQARRRFRQKFGPEQQIFEFGNHSFVAIDAPGLVDEDYRRHAEEVDFESWQGAKAGPIAFVKGIKAKPPPSDKPAILLTHIPLARPNTASCGPQREDPRGIHRGAGYGFQNLLGKETTHFVLQTVKPVLVFSGDDHDYCDYVHRNPSHPGGDIREVSIRTFSMAEGVRRPGFHLLSLYTPPGGMPRRADTPCLLPDQKHTYTFVYFPFFFLTVAYISYINATLMQGGGRGSSAPASSATPGSSRGLYLQPIRTSSAMELPMPPTHLSVRRTPSYSNLGHLTPRSRPSSRPASPLLGPSSGFPSRDDEDTVITNASYFPPSPLLPSAIPFSEPDEIEEGLLPPSTLAPPSPRPRPRTASMSSQTGSGGGLKKWLKDGDNARHGWRRSASLFLDSMYLRLPQKGSGPTSAMGALASSMERIWLRVVKDLAQTAWPPLLVVSFVWWRLLSW